MKSKNLRTRNDLPEKTRREMITLLNQHLADILDLGLQMKQAHWNVKGHHFIGLHELFDRVTEELYDSIFNTNVKGLLFTVQKALPLLPDGASIILNASIGGNKGRPANGVYSASKAAIRSFARTWTMDLKDRHIRVNAVSPGVTETPGLSGLLASSESQASQQRLNMINSIPLGRLGTPEEIAKAVAFLACDDSSYITGIELSVDGGLAQV
jgi:NAD(P)-dependent dehydrogenase (short-subunit alcohol dehydrogenase family)